MVNSITNFDPTKTITLRRSFDAILTKQFKALSRDIVSLIVTEDAFGLKEETRLLLNKRWKYTTQDQAVLEFEKWLNVQVDKHLLSLPEADKWGKFIGKGFEKGASRAFDDTDKKTRKAALDSIRGYGFVEGKREQFLRLTLSKPSAIEKLRVLQNRALSDVKGMTDDFKAKTKRILTDGLVKGWNPSQIATEIAKVNRISLHRAKTIAYTELVRAHAEGQLEALEQLGVKEVGVAVEWSTTANPCKLCQPLGGIVLTIAEARGMIPRHVNCRCAWTPANVAEDIDERKKQKRGKYKIDKAIKQSEKREGETNWGPAKDIARERPKPIINVGCCEHMTTFAKLLEKIKDV